MSSRVDRSERLINLTYVSACRIARSDLSIEIDAILAGATVRNARDQISGALLFTGTHFVQTLEGQAPSVSALMASLHRDPRHAALSVIDRHDVTQRNFASWTMPYLGPSLFVSRVVARGLASFHSGRTAGIEQVLRMMIEFGLPPPFRPK